MHHILGNFRNTNWSFYHVHPKELDAQYAANVCTLIAQGMYYIWRHGTEEIRMPDPVGSKLKMAN